MTELEFYKTEWERATKGIAELEKENEELKAQIKKMKQCGNCKHFEPITSYCKNKEQKIMAIFRNCDRWELGE